MFDVLLGSLEHLGTASYWAAFFIALGLATAVGILPGIGGTLVMAVALPIILISVKDPIIGILMLAVITGTSNTFDSIPAQLMGVVNAGTQVTFLEGHQLARKGLGAYSLGAVYAVSAIGGLVGAFGLLLAIPFIRPFILKMSFAEIAMLALFGIMMVAVLSRGAAVKGLVAGLLGLLAATVGLQTYTGVDRFTLGNFDLQFGLPLIATVMGFMAIPEIVDLAITGRPVAPENATVSTREVFRGFREGLRRWKMAVRHSLIGVTLGAIPGASASSVTWISYAVGMSMTKDKSEFGKGSLDGLLFAESSENAKEGGQAIPTLALGIPGSTSWALVIVAMIGYGLVPGPDILTDHADVIGLIVISFALANLVLTLLALLVTRQLMRVTTIPYPAVAGTVFPIMLVGAFFDSRAMVVFPVMLVFAILGMAMKAYGWPRPPFLLAFILGPTIEDNLHDSISVYGVWGSLARPITIGIFVVSIGIVVLLYRAMARSDEVRADVATVSISEDVKELASRQARPDPDAAEALAASQAIVAEASANEDSAPARRQFRLYWRTEHLLPLAFIVLGTVTLIVALGFDRTAAQVVPVGASAGVILLCAIQLCVQARSPVIKRGRVMDLDVRSFGVDNAKRSALIMSGIIGVYLLALVLFGIRWSAVLLAFLVPCCLLRGRQRIISTVVAVVLVWAFIYYIGDDLLGILWPPGTWAS